MKSYNEMNLDERMEFLHAGFRLLEATGRMQKSDTIFKPALVGLWAMSYGREVHNVWVQYDIDAEACINETIRAGVAFFTNLIEMSDDKPPPPVITPTMLQDMRGRARATIKILNDPKYRKVVADVLKEFFDDQRKQGAL
jgi:hypothetical protein